MGHYDFEKDFAEAEITEKELAKLLIEKHGAIDVVRHDGSEYDIKCKIKDKEYTFELKNELMVNTTGNVAIEFFCRGKDSGIEVTTSDYWVTKIKGDFILILTKELKARIANKEFDIIKGGGDQGSNTRFYLIKEAKLRSWCKKIS